MAKKRALDYNYAADEDFASTIGKNLTDIFRQVKASREGREEVWQESYRSWSVDKTDADSSYKGMANLKVPQLRKEVETMSRRIYKGLLGEDYLKGEPTDIVYTDLADVNTQLVRHYYDNVIQIKQPMLPWIKQNVLYGSSPSRQFWCKETNEMLYRKRVPEVTGDGTVIFKQKIVSEEVKLYNAPKIRVEDLFNNWVYPFNAQSPKDIEIHFSRTKVLRSFLAAKASEGMCHGFEKFKDSGKSIDYTYEESQERLQQFGETGQFLAIKDEKYFDLLEVWCKLILPDTTKPVLCVVEIVDNNHVTRIQRNPYWHQMMPFDWMRFIIPPGANEFYGRGLPEAGIALQHQLDDTMNQTMDANTLRLSPITIINPAYAPNSESFEVEPGATWWADPNAVKQFEFPDLTQTGMNAAGILRQMISELSDNQPQLPDPIAGKARSTGQAQLAINEWQTDLFTFIDFISTEALSPMAFKTHSLIQQFIDDDEVIRITGKYANTWINRVVTPEDIVGSYKFTWMGSLQIENQAIKTQQIMNFLKIFGTLPQDAQAQIRLIWPNIITKLLRDGFLIKDIDNVLETKNVRESTPPTLEERILKLGGSIQVVESDDDDLHLRIHRLEQQKDKDPLSRAHRTKHIALHEQQQKAKQLAIQQQQAAMLAAQQQPPAPGRRPEGNVSQIPEASSQANLERGMRVNA